MPRLPAPSVAVTAKVNVPSEYEDRSASYGEVQPGMVLTDEPSSKSSQSVLTPTSVVQENCGAVSLLGDAGDTVTAGATGTVVPRTQVSSAGVPGLPSAPTPRTSIVYA